jgi:hypothetical protein
MTILKMRAETSVRRKRRLIVAGHVVGPCRCRVASHAGGVHEPQVLVALLRADEAVNLYEQMKAPEVMTIAESSLDLRLGHPWPVAMKRHDEVVCPSRACSLICSIAALNPTGVPLEPARRSTYTSSMRFPTTTAGTASAKRR